MDNNVQKQIDTLLKLHNLNDIYSKDEKGLNIAHYAVALGYVDVVKELLKIDEENYNNPSSENEFESFFYEKGKTTPVDYAVFSTFRNENTLECIDLIKSSNLYNNKFANRNITKLLFGDKFYAGNYLQRLLPKAQTRSNDDLAKIMIENNNILVSENVAAKIQDRENNYFIDFFFKSGSPLISTCLNDNLNRENNEKEENTVVYNLFMEIMKQDLSKLNETQVSEIKFLNYISLHAENANSYALNHNIFCKAIRENNIKLLKDILVADNNCGPVKFIDQKFINWPELDTIETLNAVSYAVKYSDSVDIISTIISEDHKQLYEDNSIDINGETKTVSTLQIICEECAKSNGDKKIYLYDVVKAYISKKPELVRNLLNKENENETIANVIMNACGYIINETDAIIDNLPTMYKDIKKMENELNKISKVELRNEIKNNINPNLNINDVKKNIKAIKAKWEPIKKEYRETMKSLEKATKKTK